LSPSRTVTGRMASSKAMAPKRSAIPPRTLCLAIRTVEVDCGRPEPGHRSAVEPDGPRDKVGALQAAVAEGCCFGKTGLVDKPGSGVNVLVAEWPKLPRPSSTLPQLTNATVKLSRH
jgi:hypothetical protein